MAHVRCIIKLKQGELSLSFPFGVTRRSGHFEGIEKQVSIIRGLGESKEKKKLTVI